MKLVWLCFLAFTSPGCATEECQIHGAKRIVVPAEEECPSISEAQRQLDAGEHAAGETVESDARMESYPSGTMCWYRWEAEGRCPYESREALLPSGVVEPTALACDAQGWLYGVQSTGGADECAATIMPHGAVLTFVGADDYPARKECIYETSYTETCVDVGRVPGGGGLV